MFCIRILVRYEHLSKSWKYIRYISNMAGSGTSPLSPSNAKLPNHPNPPHMNSKFPCCPWAEKQKLNLPMCNAPDSYCPILDSIQTVIIIYCFVFWLTNDTDGNFLLPNHPNKGQQQWIVGEFFGQHVGSKKTSVGMGLPGLFLLVSQGSQGSRRRDGIGSDMRTKKFHEDSNKYVPLNVLLYIYMINIYIYIW